MQRQSGLFMRDVYPDSGLYETSTIVQPDAEDQQALTDNQELAENVNTEGSTNKVRLFAVIGIIVGVTFVSSLLAKN